MSHYQEYKTQRALEFIDNCERQGIGFSIEADELCVHFTQAACADICMTWFSRCLEWLADEIAEIVVRRGARGHLTLVALNGRAV